jgi:hypothetical protein
MQAQALELGWEVPALALAVEQVVGQGWQEEVVVGWEQVVMARALQDWVLEQQAGTLGLQVQRPRLG